MAVRTYLEDALKDIDYDNLEEWVLTESFIKQFNINIKLYDYQVQAIKNAIKALSVYYSQGGGKNALYELCTGYEMPKNAYDVYEYSGSDLNQKYLRLSRFYNIKTVRNKNYIEESNFFNRMAFWMATASGKTIVLIKMIEILDYYQKQGLLPKNKIMVLLPSEKLQHQFETAVNEYNLGKERKIHLSSLKEYENNQNSPELELFNEIEVYIYRSDLLSDQQQIRRIDTGIYDNNGEWFIFMDEAHKGDKDDSVRQDYITIMSRNGFLFNFSATFTDTIDFSTTCFNFNLERFIEEGYGKNVYLSESTYKFKKKSDDFDSNQKQLQVLKSLIAFTLVKKSKKQFYYHNPLMVTLVDEINTVDADMDLFFKELEKIAVGEIEEGLIDQAKSELYKELNDHPQFQFGNEQIKTNDGTIKTQLDSITKSDILKYSFNSNSHGQIEVIEGEKGKEFALRLKTASEPFALFKMGDAATYVREKLRDNYLVIPQYQEKHYFDSLNKTSGQCFNMLIGSRTFYEGWDSNRPNVMNFINIGTGDAKKFVLQSLGRGVRIEPEKHKRKRLPPNDSNKNQLLETLFVFATNRKAIETILEVMVAQKSSETEIELVQNKILFDLFIPIYEDIKTNLPLSKFTVARESLEVLRKYVESYSDGLIMLNFGVDIESVNKLRESLIANNQNNYFKIDNQAKYKDMKVLTFKLINYLHSYAKTVSGFKKLENEIIHFKHIKISDSDYSTIAPVIKTFAEDESKKNTQEELLNLAKQLQEGSLSFEDYSKKIEKVTRTLSPTATNKIKDLRLKRLANHLYTPIILSDVEKIDYIKHVINVESEPNALDSLCSAEHSGIFKDIEWMFSKIDQTMDDKAIAMPYFSNKYNEYKGFYPDFMFWRKTGKRYDIYLVDPKGTEHTAYLQKADGFAKLFEENGNPKEFKFKEFLIYVHLKLVYDDSNGSLPELYKKYWISNEEFDWLLD